MNQIAGKLSLVAFESLMRTRQGEMLRITLDDGRTLTGRSTGRLLQVTADSGFGYELVRVSAFNVTKIEA